MPLIIATTDFTKTAGNSVHYACELALAHSADLMVMHCYSVPVLYADMPLPAPIDDVRSAAVESMDNLLAELKVKYPLLTIKSNIIYGNLVDELEEHIANNGMPLLVVAGNAYNPENTAWLDSTLIDAFRHLKCPVLAIPTDTSFTPVKKICFAYDNEYAGSELALEKLMELTKLMGAELHVLYAQADVRTQDNASDVNPDAKRVLSSVDPVYHYYYEEDADTAIHEFVAKNDIDWLVVIPRKHSFFESLFHKSHTRALVNNTHKPILALHEN